MRPSELPTDKMVTWVFYFSQRVEANDNIADDDWRLYGEIVHELLSRGVDLEGNPFPNALSRQRKNKEAVDRLTDAILEPLIPVVKGMTKSLERLRQMIEGEK